MNIPAIASSHWFWPWMKWCVVSRRIPHQDGWLTEKKNVRKIKKTLHASFYFLLNWPIKWRFYELVLRLCDNLKNWCYEKKYLIVQTIAKVKNKYVGHNISGLAPHLAVNNPDRSLVADILVILIRRCIVESDEIILEQQYGTAFETTAHGVLYNLWHKMFTIQN